MLIGATLALFFEPIFRGRVFFYGDLGLYFLPELAFLRRELLAGRLPLWNPYLNCGQPFVGNPQVWPLYPATLLLYFFEEGRANTLATMLHVLWAALGMRSFLRQQGLSSAAATLGAGAFAFGGALVSKAQFPNMLQAMSWLPWLFWAAERVLSRPSALRVAVLGLGVGLTLLAAHAQVTLMQLYLLLAWVGVWLLARPKDERLRPFLALVAAALLGGLLAIAQLLPVVEHALASTRPALSLKAANRFYLPWNELILLVFPNAYGNPALPGGWQGKANFWEPCCYSGLLTLGLALGTLRRPGLGAGRFWAWAALVSLWLALGRYAGLYLVAFYLLPGIKTFHDPARWLYLFGFCLSVLAAYGLDRLPKHAKGRLLWGIVVVTLGELVLFSRTLNPTCSPDALTALAQNTPTTTKRIFHLRPYAGWKVLAPYRRYPEAPVAGLGTTPNLPLWQGVRQAGGYEPVARKDLTQALKALGKLPAEPELLSGEQVQGLERLGVGLVYGATTVRRLEGSAPLVTGARVLAQRPGEWTLAPTQPEVVLRETAASGWRAWADGVPLTLERASPLFLQVHVPVGTKALVFRYEPTSWRLGMFISVGAGCILVALMMFGLRKKEWQS